MLSNEKMIQSEWKQEKLTNQKLRPNLACEVRPGVYYKITKK